MSPLALMVRPHGSSPHHSLALVLALTAIRASKPLPLVHITSSAPSMLIALGGENSLSNSLVRSGRDRPTVVLAAPRHQHEDNARDLSGRRPVVKGGFEAVVNVSSAVMSKRFSGRTNRIRPKRSIP